MKVFPVDALITGTGDDGLPVYDRAYSAADLRKVYGGFFTNGVFMDKGDALRVTARAGLSVTVGGGLCCINGAVGYADEPQSVKLAAAHQSHTRIDTVVARLDLSIDKRSCTIAVHAGTPGRNPVAPSLRRDSTVYELGLADVRIPAQSTNISQSQITDTRLYPARCGAVAPVVKIDASKAADQVAAQVAENLQTIQDAIDGTTAGKLQTQVDALKTEVQPIARGGTGATGLSGAMQNLFPKYYQQAGYPPTLYITGFGPGFNESGFLSAQELRGVMERIAPLAVAHGGTGATTDDHARDNLGMKKLLWSGAWTSGVINAFGASAYNVFLLESAEYAPLIVSRKAGSASLNGVASSYLGSIFLYCFSGTISGDTLSSPNYYRVPVNNPGNQQNAGAITRIWGLV